MWLEQIWRYPVKSMGGERLERAELRADGIAGDRVVHVGARDGEVLTARKYPALLGHRAELGPDGEPRVGGRPWRDPSVARDVAEATHSHGALARYDGVERFDVLPLLVATDGALREVGRDLRRFRPNLVIGGVEGLEERSWEGRHLAIGSCVIGMVSLRMRCVMTTFDPDTQAKDPAVLRDIVRRFGGTFALDCEVLVPGSVSLRDPVELLPAGSIR
jgi:uncharacterized protein YcbX